VKAIQNINKSVGKINIASKPDMRSERQISDPKKLLDEFMLPHATIMACSKNKKQPKDTTMNWRKKVKALNLKKNREKFLNKEPKTSKKEK
jgi:hypothetical protein